MILYYKNSFLASVVSILGCICILCMVLEFDSYETTESIPVILLGIALLIWGKVISNNKAFKKWWKQVENAGLVGQIATDTSVAIAVYNKNPIKATLKKIESLNPAAAEAIRAQTVKK